ncbi:MAG: hypothetical protein FWH24_05785 [Oscillospiraceae bacterium]|nr:hypothetical protein [Oscillospiraceae bacterium]
MKNTILAVLLLFVFVFAGCAENIDDGTQNEILPQDREAPAELPEDGHTEPEEEKILPDVPENLDLNGYKFRLIYEKSDNYDWATKGIEAEEETGDAINDAAYRRNAYITEKYNFELAGITYPVYELPGGTIRRFIQAGTDDFDAVILRTGESPSLVSTGAFVDLRQLPDIDTEKPWWDDNIMEQLALGHRYFALFGDFIVAANDAVRILMFNKELHRDLGLDDLYESVKEGGWTLNKFYESSRNAAHDLNGDGVMDTNDRYGILIQRGSLVCYMFGAGESTTVNDSNGFPELAVNGERMLLVLQTIHEVFNTPNLAIFDAAFPNTWADLQVAFENGQGLFFAEVLQLAERMRAGDTDFGVLPFPKFDEFQENYYSFADCRCLNGIYIPITNNNLTETGQILEVLSAESFYTVRPAYYDKSLNGKFMRDEESSEMLDIILANKVFSMDETFGWGMLNAVSGALTGNSPDFVSVIERQTQRSETSIQRTINNILDLD